MATETIRILLVEDNSGDVRLLRVYLADAGASRFELTHAEALTEALARLKGAAFDVVLLDLSLPDSSGLETVERVRAAAPTLPIVVLSGLDDEETAVEAVKHGAQDYLVKGRIDSALLIRAMRYAIERMRIVIELERVNEFKNQLLGIAAHDLRNPLSVILAASSFLLEDSAKLLPAERKTEFISRIKKNSEFMALLIDDLLDFAAIESGKVSLSLVPTDVVGLVRQNVEQNRMLAEPKGIPLELGSAGPLPVVAADPARLDRVLNNLIGNAVKFSDAGAQVTVSAARLNGSVVVSVQDHGPGIPREELSKLFRPFSKTSVRSTAGERSTGLGLAICREIIEAHGGHIWAESEVGKGSVFSFSLPVAAPR